MQHTVVSWMLFFSKIMWWSPKPQYLVMWAYSDTGFLQGGKKIKNEVIRVGPNPI